MKPGKLMSSCGSVTFDVSNGAVLQCDLDPEDYPEATRPRVVDVDEWLRRYPGESKALPNEHDILDFGYWMDEGKYEPPCETWRLEREALRKDACSVSRVFKRPEESCS